MGRVREPYEPTVAWFRERCIVTDSGCWEWQGQRLKGAGYGRFQAGHRDQRYAHREVARIVHGEPPADKPWCLHSCDNPPCVNPDHLSWGTNSQNVREAWQRNRGWSPFLADGEVKRAMTHCKRGHPFDDANTHRYVVVTVSGRLSHRRTCRACGALMKRLAKERRLAEHADDGDIWTGVV